MPHPREVPLGDLGAGFDAIHRVDLGGTGKRFGRIIKGIAAAVLFGEQEQCRAESVLGRCPQQWCRLARAHGKCGAAGVDRFFDRLGILNLLAEKLRRQGEVVQGLGPLVGGFSVCPGS